MGGAIAAGDGAFAHRDANYDVLIAANWTDPADQDRCVAWARDTAAALEPHSRGGYVNYEPDANGAYVPAAFGDRLARLGSTEDPIRPAQRLQPEPERHTRTVSRSRSPLPTCGVSSSGHEPGGAEDSLEVTGAPGGPALLAMAPQRNSLTDRRRRGTWRGAHLRCRT